MTCPVCTATAEPLIVTGPVAICASCGHTLHIDEAGTVRRATLRDIEALTDEQVRALRAARVPLVRRRR